MTAGLIPQQSQLKRSMSPARRLFRATSARTVELAGIEILKMYVMVNTKRKIKRGDLLPWFLEDHATLPAWYIKDCKEFFEWLKLDHKQRKKLN